MGESIIQTKFIEVPYGVSMSDKIAMFNVWLSDLQRNGFNILSTSPLQRQELPNGDIVEGFVIEYRESI